MSVLAIVLACIDILAGVIMIVLFLLQEGNDNGMGVISGGSSDSFYSKAKGRTLEEKLKSGSLICAIIFSVVSVLLFLVFARGW